MKLDKLIENYLKAEPTKRYSAADIAVRFGRSKAVAKVLRRIRSGFIPHLYFSKERTPNGLGMRFEYFYVPEGAVPVTKVMTFREFVEKGYLQEANRLFFNPLGMSLAVTKTDAPSLIVYDFRDSACGVSFSPEVMRDPKFKERVEYIEIEGAAKKLARQIMGKFEGKLVRQHRRQN